MAYKEMKIAQNSQVNQHFRLLNKFNALSSSYQAPYKLVCKKY